MAYGIKDHGQHSVKQWLIAWLHQPVTWPNADFSSLRTCCIHSPEINLTYKQLEMHACVLSNVATDAVVLNHQAISTLSADYIFIALD